MPHLHLAFINVADNRYIPTIMKDINQQALMNIDRVDAEILVHFASPN